MATEEKTKKSKKKVVITVVVVIVIVLVIGAIVSFVFMRGGMGGGGDDSAATTSVSSVTAELGDVSTTITGSGTLAAGTTTDVTMPSGLSVDEVYVEEGDSVEEGDALATVSLASIAQALLDARESLSTVEEQIANLSDAVSDTTSDEYLESIILYDEQESLTEEVEALEALLADPTITATASGTIGSVNVSTDSSSSASSSTSSTSSTESTDSSALASLLSGSTTTATDSSDASSTTSASTSLSSTGLSLTTAFTIVSDEDATITLSIDEADILSVEVGQTAVVEVDSIEDETFEGTVTEVSTSSSSTSGSVKYTAVITIERTDEMLLGMSASATITIDEATDAVLIPVSALQESGSTTFVYTEVDEDGNLGGEVEVETGLSDGDEVEILSGLSEGDVVYYTRTSSDNSGLGGLLSALGGGQGGGEGGEGESGGPDAE